MPRQGRRLPPCRAICAGSSDDLRMGFGAEDLPPPTSEQWLALGASVFDADGEVTLMISLHGFDRLTAADFDDCTRQLAATAQRVTELTGGRAPPVE